MSKGKQKVQTKLADEVLTKLISEIAISQSLKPIEVSDILQFTYRFIADKIRRGKGEGVRMPYWGVFGVKNRTRKRLEAHQIKKLLKPDKDAKNRT